MPCFHRNTIRFESPTTGYPPPYFQCTDCGATWPEKCPHSKDGKHVLPKAGSGMNVPCILCGPPQTEAERIAVIMSDPALSPSQKIDRIWTPVVARAPKPAPSRHTLLATDLRLVAATIEEVRNNFAKADYIPATMSESVMVAADELERLGRLEDSFLHRMIQAIKFNTHCDDDSARYAAFDAINALLDGKRNFAGTK